MIKKIVIVITIVVVLYFVRQAVMVFLPMEPKSKSFEEAARPCAHVIVKACYKGVPFLCENFSSSCSIPRDWE